MMIHCHYMLHVIDDVCECYLHNGGIHNTSQVMFLTQPKGNLSPYTENRRMIAIQPFLWCKDVDPMKSKHQERLIISS